MPDNLLSLFPTPEALLAQEPEDLAGALMEVVPGASQNGMFNYHGLIAPLFPAIGNTGYPPRLQGEVQRALAEAVQWLMSQGLVIRDPEQPGEWYRLTRRGAMLRTRADVTAFRRGARPDVGLGFASDTPQPLRSSQGIPPGALGTGATEVFPPTGVSAGDPPSGTTLVTPLAETPSPTHSVMSSGAMPIAAPAGGSASGREKPDGEFPWLVQTYLVTTPLRLPPNFIGATLFSLTLRFSPSYHNTLAEHLSSVLTEEFEGWNRELVTSGAALLNRLAAHGSEVSQPLRTAIVDALDNYAAALRFSDPRSFTAKELVTLGTGVAAFSAMPAGEALVGVVLAGTSIVFLQVAWALGTSASYAITELSRAWVDKTARRLRENPPAS